MELHDARAYAAVNVILRQAVEEHCEEIRVSCADNRVVLQFRVDGAMSARPAPTASGREIIARLKYLSQFEKNPREAAFSVKRKDQMIDVRLRAPSENAVSLRLEYPPAH